MTAFVVSQPAALLSRGGRAGLAGVTGRRAPAPRSAVARAPASVTMHGPPAGAQSTEKRPGSHKGFVEEMRFVAMRLHTKDQAPSEGKMEESALPIDAWLPSHAEYLQFLVDSLAMYKYFEEDLPVEETTIFPRFVNTGLERVEALHKDIAYINSLGVETPEPTRAATSYVAYLKNLVAGKPEAVLVHWYNFLVRIRSPSRGGGCALPSAPVC
jgi:heme oxygenase (biliverdin-producing, ferredoxin)